MDVFYTYAVDVAGSVISQVRNSRLNPALNIIREGPGGHVDPQYNAIGGGQPAFNVTSTQIATALGICDFDGTALSGVNNFTAWMIAGEEGGLRKTGSDHVKFTVTEGLMYPLTLRAPHTPPATIDYNVIASYDGTNSPIIIASGQSISITPGTTQLYCAGPLLLGATEIEGVQDITLTFGITPEVQGEKGIVWPTYVGIRSRMPSVIVRFLDASYLANVDLEGWTGACTFYLTKLKEGGTREPAASAVHIKCTLADVMATVGDSGAAHPNVADNTITVTPRDDTTNPVVDFDFASILP